MEDQIIITTGDLRQEYDVIGPVFFQLSNRNRYNSELEALKTRYREEFQARKQAAAGLRNPADWELVYGEWSFDQSDYEAACFLAAEELKKRARMLGADAVICLRQDAEMDTMGTLLYIHLYGTAVKLRARKRAYDGGMPRPVPLSGRPGEPEARIFYCPSCSKGFLGTAKKNCPTCNSPTVDTGILHSEWKSFSEDRKREIIRALAKGQYDTKL